MGSLQEQGIQFGQEDYERALTVLLQSDIRGEGLPDKEETAKLLQHQLQQLRSIFSSDTV